MSLKSKKLFVDGRMHGRTFETGFIRSTLSKSQTKNAEAVRLNKVALHKFEEK